MSQNLQVEVLIKDQNQKQLKTGNYKAIQIDFAPQEPAKANITFNGNSIPIQKQRIQITFPNQDTYKIKGNNFGEPAEPNSPNVIRVNANTITIEDASDSNSIKEIYVLPGADGSGWEKLTQINNLSKVLISKSKDGGNGGNGGNVQIPGIEDLLSKGKLLWSSEVWNNGKKRTIKEQGEKDPEDSKLQVRAGNDGKRKFEIDGKGTALLSGNQSRVYINAHNYNVAMQFTYTHRKSLESLSLRMRSLRNEFEEDEDNSKRFGGYGLIVTRDKFKTEYQPSKEQPKADLVSKELPKKLPEDSPVTVRWWVKDDGDDKIEVKAWVKYEEGGKFEEVINVASEKFEKIARDKDQFFKSGVAWIRANGIDGKVSPTDIPIKDVYIIEVDK